MAQISIIVPVYRAEDCLGRCVDSVLTQTFTNWELILVEDGSPDGSGALCDRFAADDSRIRVFHKENGGVSSARNLGIREALGDYITFVDSDDWIAPTMLEDLYTALTAAKADSAGCGLTYITSDGATTTEPGVLPKGVYQKEEIREKLLAPLAGNRVGGGVINGYSVRFLFSHAILLSKEITFEGAYLEDEIFLLDYFFHANTLAMVEGYHYYYFQNPQSVTRRYLPTYLETFQRFLVRKEACMAAYDLESLCPQWRESTALAGLLIAIGNEYAKGNSASFGEKSCRVREIVDTPSMKHALEALHPQGLGRNKDLVLKLVRMRQFWLLTALYYFKNRRG